MGTTWTPYDFITNGEFADALHVRDLVRKIRISAGAAGGLLLVYQGTEFFQSLLYLSLADEELQQRVQDELTAKEVHVEEKEAIAGFLRGRRELSSRLRHETFAPIFEAIKPSRQTLLLPRLRPRVDFAPDPIVGVVCFDPADAACESADTAALLDALAVAVAASAQVYLRRLESRLRDRRQALTEGQKRIEKYFEELFSTGNPDRPAANVEAAREIPPVGFFLEKVLEKVGAMQGGVFMRFEPERLHAIARTARQAPGREFTHFHGLPLIELKRRRGGVVSRVCMKKQPYLFNHRQDFEQMNVNTGFISVASEVGVEIDAGLAVPIYDRHNRGRGVLPMGVLNVEKSFGEWEPGADGARPFSLVDYLFIQEAAECLAEVWTRGWSKGLPEATARIMRKLRPYSLRHPVPEADESASGDRDGLPSDFAAAKPRIDSFLARACKGLPSIAECTVRVLSINQATLTRLASYGPVRTDDRGEVSLTEAEHEYPSIASCAKHGEMKHGQVHLPGDMGTAHQIISLPLFLESRCVGVVTFSSKFPPDAFSYDDLRSLRTIADAVSVVLAYAQTQALRPILVQAARVFESMHELNKIPDRALTTLKDLEQQVGERTPPGRASRPARAPHESDAIPGGVDDPEPRARDSGPADAAWLAQALQPIRDDLAWFRNKLDEYEQARTADPRTVPVPTDCSVAKVVETVLGEPSVRRLFAGPCKGPSDGAHEPDLCHGDAIDPLVQAACLEAMSDLVNNAKRELSGLNKQPRGKISVSWRLLGGRQFACITMRNPMTGPLDPRLREILYREPVVSGDRLHCGAFLSAWLIRAVGGDIHLADGTVEDGHRLEHEFGVTVEIPLRMDQPHSRGQI